MIGLTAGMAVLAIKLAMILALAHRRVSRRAMKQAA